MPRTTPLIGIVLQVSDQSLRLPRKSTRLLNRHRLYEYSLAHMFQSSPLILYPHEFIIQTPASSKEYSLLEAMKQFRIMYFPSIHPVSFYQHGAKEDIEDFSFLTRYPGHHTSRFTHIIRLTADNPLIPPHLIANLIKEAVTHPNPIFITRSDRIPVKFHICPGLDIECFSYPVLERASFQLSTIYKENSYILCYYPSATMPFSQRTSLTVDYLSDLRRLSRFCSAHQITPFTSLTLSQLLGLTLPKPRAKKAPTQTQPKEPQCQPVTPSPTSG